MKKTSSLLGLFVLFTLIFSACKEEVEPVVLDEAQPTADFKVEQSGGKEDPFTFTFNNLSKDFKEVRWEFGDDSVSIDVSPSHTFLKEGSFKVKLRTMNNKGNWAVKETVVKIVANDIIDIVATPLGDGSLDLSLKSEANIDSLFWFKGIGADTVLIKKGEIANIKLNEGEFKDYTLGVKTPNGSKIGIERLLTNTGIVRDITKNGRLLASRENGTPDSFEGTLKLVDNNIKTKHLLSGFSNGIVWFRLEYFTPMVVNAYTLTSANDNDGRDPKAWVFEGSNDGENWTMLDTRKEEFFNTMQLSDPKNPESELVSKPARFLTRIFTFENTTPYLFYRWHVTAIKGGTVFQLAEWRVLEIPK